jgi:hypothetical protein
MISLTQVPLGLVAKKWKARQRAREAAATWEEHGLIFTDEHGHPIDGSTRAQAFKKLQILFLVGRVLVGGMYLDADGACPNQ